MAKAEGTYKAQCAKLMREGTVDGKDLNEPWWGDRPRNRWVFVIARHCGWTEGMTHASQRTVR